MAPELHEASTSLLNLKKLSKHSTFNPVVPSSYSSAENLWSCLLKQAYSHDKVFIDKRMVLNKTTKRLQILAKLVSVFEDTIWKPEHSEMVEDKGTASDANVFQNSHCPCCFEEAKRVHILETQLQKETQSNIDKDGQIRMLELQLRGKEKYCNDTDEKLTQCYVEISELRHELAARSLLETSMQNRINELSKMVSDFSLSHSSHPPSCLPSKEICVSTRATGGAPESRRLNVPSPGLGKCMGQKSNKFKKNWRKCRIFKSASLAMEHYRNSVKSEICPAKSLKPNAGYSASIALSARRLKACCKSHSNENHRKYYSVKCFSCGENGHISKNCYSVVSIKQRTYDKPSCTGKQKKHYSPKNGHRHMYHGGKKGPSQPVVSDIQTDNGQEKFQHSGNFCKSYHPNAALSYE